MKPITRYTKSGRINIAYQVIGDGPIDLVYIPGWISNIDLMWDCRQLVKFFNGITKFARLILFDKRGTGLSDRVSELSTLEDRMDDIRAVMDAVGSQKAVLFGHSEGGSVSALFAATYPNRVKSLITFGVFAKRRWSENYPWAPTDEERQKVYDMIEKNWGSGEMDLVSLAPSMKQDPVFMNWLASYFRSGASPSAALALTKMNTEVDIIDILNTIEVPSLFMCRTGDIDVKVEESKFMAEKIKGAKLLEFSGNDHLFWVGNTEEVIQEITEFVTGGKVIDRFDKTLSTILFTEIEDSIEWLVKMGESAWFNFLEEHNELVRSKVNQFRGKIYSRAGNGFVATFDGPSKAVHCGIAIRQAMKLKQVKIQMGVHSGECIITPDNSVAGLAVHIASKVQQMSKGDEILVTQTVKNLLSGAGLNFTPKGSTRLKGIDDPISVLSVRDVMLEGDSEFEPTSLPTSHGKHHTFLENVLQSIESHLKEEDFNIEILCKEVGVSERQLQRKLKSIANKTPNQMIRSVRLHKAKEFLLGKHFGISEAAYSTGFNSLSYFTKCFKKEFGMAPSEMMKNAS